MIKCNIDKKRKIVKVQAGGEGYDICIETLAFIGEVYRGINRQNIAAGEAFRKTIIDGVLNPNSPVFKDTENSAIDDHSDGE